MINYTEKGTGLHDAISRAGHWLEQRDGAWIADDEAAVQEIIDAYTLDDARAARCAEVIAKATDLFNQAISGYSRGELTGWPILRAEALAYTADPGADVPNVALEAQMRGCDVPTLVSKVLANAQFYDTMRAQIAGNSGKHRDAINALADFDAIANYDYSTGWPEV
jgi:hypothetical protein